MFFNVLDKVLILKFTICLWTCYGNIHLSSLALECVLLTAPTLDKLLCCSRNEHTVLISAENTNSIS